MKTAALILTASLIAGCSSESTAPSEVKSVPHQKTWGIYSLNLPSEKVELIYSTSEVIQGLDLDDLHKRLAFAEEIGGDTNQGYEIMMIGVDGSDLTQLTDNDTLDLYPSFSPDGNQLIFLRRRSTIDIYIMNADGSGQQLLYDSGANDADVDWGRGGRIAFTRNSQIWTIKDDGTDAQQLSDPANAGQWGNANLPIGDYDPRFNSDGGRIAFERMDDVSQEHGGYNIYAINLGGTDETQLTTTTYSQGFPNWSSTDTKIVYIVAAISGAGKYDMYIMNADGTGNQTITPGYFPAEFLCHTAVFSSDDAVIYFIGQWYS